MGAADRTVQHLHLRAPTAQAAVRAVHRLEDALRCASLPDTGERLLLVRRLHLGRLPEGLSSQSLSLLIEQRVAAVGGEWVHGDDQPRAACSDTVFFASRLQAAQAAVRRRAEGHSLTAWHWRLALPGVQLDAGDQAFLDSVFARLASEATAPVSLPALVADTVAAGHVSWLVRHASVASVTLLKAIGGVQRQALLAEREWSAAAVGQPLAQSPRVQDPQVVAFRYRCAAAPGSGAPTDLHAPLWVHAVLRAANWASTGALVDGASAQPGAFEPFDPARHTRPGAEEAEPATPGPSGLASEPWDPAAGRSVAPHGGAAPVAQRPGAAAPPVRVGHSVGAPGPLLPTMPAPFDHLTPTGVGGLLFLVPVLERLGFGAWQQQHADRPMAGLVLRQVLQRLRVPADDAAWSLVASLPMPPPAPALLWQTPPAWSDERIGIGHDLVSALEPREMAERWRLACSRYLRRVARIGLARLCLRQARVRWSATHLDVCFPLAAVDLRVRRSALDVDPGWVDWLERVVGFEYAHEGPP